MSTFPYRKVSNQPLNMTAPAQTDVPCTGPSTESGKELDSQTLQSVKTTHTASIRMHRDGDELICTAAHVWFFIPAAKANEQRTAPRLHSCLFIRCHQTCKLCCGMCMFVCTYMHNRALHHEVPVPGDLQFCIGTYQRSGGDVALEGFDI